MSKKKVAYITATVLFSIAILPGAILDIVQPEMMVEVMANLGIPLYIGTLIGVWKLLGVAALARPKFKRINEWAYAGFFFDLTGAAYVHAASGDNAGSAPPLVLLAVLVASYVMRGRNDEAVLAAPG